MKTPAGCLSLSILFVGTALHACPPGSPSEGAEALQPLAIQPDIKPFVSPDLEREMKRLRHEYFRQRRNVEIRQIGIDHLRAYTDPACFDLLLEVFGGEAEDVQDALADHFADLESDKGDATLAWTAIHSKEEHLRDACRDRLSRRVHASGGASNMVQTAIAAGLKSKKDSEAGRAAELANRLDLFQAIPAMANAQVTGGGGGGGGGRGGGDGRGEGGSLGFIMVATQQAFISDLTPVVGDSAVGFDPELSVVTNGTYLRVMDAVVTTYRTEVHYALVDLSTRGFGGQSTASLGYDPKVWRAWYKDQFLPYRDKLAAAADAQPSQPQSPPVTN